MKDDTKTTVWQRYEKGKNLHEIRGMYSNTEKAYNFYEDRQWAGVETDQNLPFFNIIKPIVKFKVASVCANNLDIVYSAMNAGEFQRQAAEICNILNKYVAQQEELLKMETLTWHVVKNAAIAGDAYLYFYMDDENKLQAQIIDNVNIYLSNEQSADIQSQKYIIIEERRFVEDVKEEAKRNKVKDIDKITSDDEFYNHAGNRQAEEIKVGDGSCTSLLMFEKKNGKIYFSRSVRNVVYQPETEIAGLKLFPIVGLIWGEKKYSSRGIGEVIPLVPNQIEINKTIVRRAITIKNTAYPRLAYNVNSVENEADLDKVGIHIKLKNTQASRVNDLISYLYPAQTSPDAKAFTDELINVTKDLAGAGDVALGHINPEQASGIAIIAVRDQTMIPLNEHIQRLRQFKEDIARVMFDMWVAYNPNGLSINIKDNGEMVSVVISAEELAKLDVNVKVDVSPTNPYSRFAQEQSLQNLFAMGAITFEEYVQSLDDNAVMPKSKLEEILESRKTDMMQQAATVIQDLQAQNAELQQQVQAIPQVIDEAIMTGANKERDNARKQQEIQELMNIG